MVLPLAVYPHGGGVSVSPHDGVSKYFRRRYLDPPFQIASYNTFATHVFCKLAVDASEVRFLFAWDEFEGGLRRG
jgi:hypothetical protein